MAWNKNKLDWIRYKDYTIFNISSPEEHKINLIVGTIEDATDIKVDPSSYSEAIDLLQDLANKLNLNLVVDDNGMVKFTKLMGV